MTEQAPVHVLFEPDAGAMREHLEHMFGGYLDGFHDGLIELAWTDTTPTDGRYALRHASLFGTDAIEQLIAEAIRLNRQTMCNVYIGAALRKPKTWPNARASAGDVLALTCAYADLDDKDVASVARKRWNNATPTKIVITGREPHLRAQMWWRLDEPITDQRVSETLLKGIAATMHSDPTVTDAPRVMRLAGSIAWPMKPDRKRPEITSIAHIKEPGQPIYTVDHLAQVFPFEGVRTPDTPDGAVRTPHAADGIHHATTALGLPGEVDDGRRRYMLKTINAVLIELIGTSGRVPTAQELFNAAWGQYERNTDLTRSGRGADEFAKECVYTIGRFMNGKIRGCETIEAVQALYRQRQSARSQQPHRPPDFGAEFAKADAAAKTDPNTLYELLDVPQIKNLSNPKWLVEGMVVEQALGFIYGPPGCLKTFIALDMTLSLSCARPDWWGKPIQRSGVVIYLTTEGTGSFKYRIMAWEKHRNVDADPALFRMMKTQINFMKAEDVGKLLATVQYAVDQWGPVAAVVVDTVSRVLPGSDENLQKDMTIFVAACDAVRLRFGTTVIGLHHASRSGNMRGSTVLGAAGDFVLAVEREPGAMTGIVFAEKIKDAEDGWTRPFKVTKVPVGVLGINTSLAVDGTDAAVDNGDDSGWPSRDVCLQILAAIDEQWQAGQPWCWSANSPRCAAKNIINRWDHIRLSMAEDILNKWHARGVICEEVRDAKNHIKGYRKLTDL